jgi:hypothetical protein
VYHATVLSTEETDRAMRKVREGAPLTLVAEGLGGRRRQAARLVRVPRRREIIRAAEKGGIAR